MQRGTGQQYYYVVAEPKIGEYHILTKRSKCNSFQVTSDLLNSENCKVAIGKLCNELQVCSFTML